MWWFYKRKKKKNVEIQENFCFFFTFFCSQGSADIIPKVQTATEHSHFFNTFLHVSENASFGQTHARNHLNNSNVILKHTQDGITKAMTLFFVVKKIFYFSKENQFLLLYVQFILCDFHACTSTTRAHTINFFFLQIPLFVH